MRFNKLDLNLLVALDALLTERSVSRAADKLFLSQSAMSNALGRLREHFDDPLLVQMGRKMSLTPRAEVLIDPVRDILVRIEATVSSKPDFDALTSEREFSLLVSDYTITVLMPHLIELISQEAPNVRLRFVAQLTQPERMLERGTADFLVIPKGFCSHAHPLEVLYEEAFVCVVWNQSDFGERITKEEYLQAQHVEVEIPGPNASTFDHWFLEKYGVVRKAATSTFSFASVPRLVVGTNRIATIHARLARQLSDSLPIRILDLPVEMPFMQQCAQWHTHHSSDPGIRWLRSMLYRAVARMEAQVGTPS